MIRSTFDVPWQSDQPSTLIGCFLIFPAASVGTFMILDYPGPPGPLGFAEFFGWWAICLGIAFLTTKLLAKGLEERPYRYRPILAAIAAPVIITTLLWWEVQPTTPGAVKNAVEYGQQAIGVFVIVAFVGRLFRGRFSKSGYRNAQHGKGVRRE